LHGHTILLFCIVISLSDVGTALSFVPGSFDAKNSPPGMRYGLFRQNQSENWKTACYRDTKKTVFSLPEGMQRLNRNGALPLN
jgi:hypothetical protein